MKNIQCYLLIGCLIAVLGCNRQAATSADVAEYDRQVKENAKQLEAAVSIQSQTQAQLAISARQQEETQRQLENTAKQAERYEKLLQRWEKQADRQDKILDQQEKTR